MRVFLTALSALFLMSGCVNPVEGTGAEPATPQPSLDPTAAAQRFQDARSATLICPDGDGGYDETREVPNDPYRDGCWAKPMDVSIFFTAKPYSCATLKIGQIHAGRYPWGDGRSMEKRLCVDVRSSADFKKLQYFGKHDQMIGIVHQSVAVQLDHDAEPRLNHVPYFAGKGELVVIGIPDAHDRPPKLTDAIDDIGSLFNWHPNSGNMVLVNLWFEKTGMPVQFGSSRNPQPQTLTLVGITHHTTSRLAITRFEGGDDPTLPINDEVYLKNVLVYGARHSHNVYLDRNRVHYMEGVISYGNERDSNHALKSEARYLFLYGSYLSNAGIWDELPDDSSGLAGLSAASCQTGIVRGNVFTNSIRESRSNQAAAQAQIRKALPSCDWPQGYYPNTYPTKAYRGPLEYLGQRHAQTPFWDEDWWLSIRAAGIEPPQVYGNADMLLTYYLDNTIILRNETNASDTAYYGLMSQGTFPATSPSAGSYQVVPAPDMPPKEWFERSRMVVSNNCFTGDLLPSNKFLNHRQPGMDCSDSNANWLGSWPACRDGAATVNDSDRAIFVGANDCNGPDPLAPEISEALARLEVIPEPPWREW